MVESSSFSGWAHRKIAKMGVFEIGAIKVSAFLFGLLLAKFWPGILGLHWGWYLTGVIVAAIPALYRAYLTPDTDT